MIRLSRLFLAVFPVLALAAALGGCKHVNSNPFPASGEISGWQKTDDTRVFAAKDLWQYIDGDSEQYVQAGVVSTSTSDYKYEDQMEAVVDVYTMRDTAGAQTIMEAGHGADAHSIALGDSGFAYTQSVVFRKGPILVRIVAFQAAPNAPQALLALAHGVEAKL